MVGVLTFPSLVPVGHLCTKLTNFKNIPFFSSYCDMSSCSIFSSRFCRSRLFVTTSIVFIITVSSVTCELKPFIKYLYEMLGTDLLGGEWEDKRAVAFLLTAAKCISAPHVWDCLCLWILFVHLEKEAETLFVSFFKYWSERSLSIKRPNALAWQNGLLARVHMIRLIIQLSYSTVSVIHRVGDLQISVEGSLTPC